MTQRKVCCRMAIIDTEVMQKLIKKKSKCLRNRKKKVTKMYELVGELFPDGRAKLKYMKRHGLQ